MTVPWSRAYRCTPSPHGITEYGGVTFRSHLEARRAAYFDRQQLKGKGPALPSVSDGPISRSALLRARALSSFHCMAGPPWSQVAGCTGCSRSVYNQNGLAEPVDARYWCRLSESLTEIFKVFDHLGRRGYDIWRCPVSRIMETGAPSASVGTSLPTYQTTYAATARCEMMERATPAKLRYLERLLANANTTWAMVQRRWPEAPVCPL